MKHKEIPSTKLCHSQDPIPMICEQWPNRPSHFNQIPRICQTGQPNIPTTTKHSTEL